MLKIDLKTDCVDTRHALSILQRNTDELGIFVDLDICTDYIAYFNECVYRGMQVLWKIGMPRSLNTNSPTESVQLFRDVFGIPAMKLVRGGYGGNSSGLTVNDTKRDELLEDPEISDDVKLLIKLFSIMSTWKHTLSALKSYSNHPPLKVHDFEGHKITLIKPKWNALATHRFSSKDPNIQGLKRSIKDIYTHLENQILVYSDSSQIEPRIKWSHFTRDELIINLINLYGDAYYGLLHYVTMNDDDRQRGVVQKSELDKGNRDTLKTLVLATSYGSVDGKFDPVIYAKTKQHIQNHPKHIEWVDEVTRQVRSGARVFYTAFGTPIHPQENDRYKLGDKGWEKHLVRCGINNPIQGTSAEFAKISLKKIDTELSLHARSPFSAVAGNIHDANMTYLALQDKELLPEIDDVLAYEVDGWAKIPCETKLGRQAGLDREDNEKVLNQCVARFM